MFHVAKLSYADETTIIIVSSVNNEVSTNDAGDGRDDDLPEVVNGLWLGSFGDESDRNFFSRLGKCFVEVRRLLWRKWTWQVQGLTCF